MAVYKIFPEKDAFIHSASTTANTGKDEILEINGYPNTSGTGITSRTLIQFSSTEIDSVINNEIGNTNFTSSIKLYLAEAGELPIGYSIYGYPVYSTAAEWDNGKGKYGDLPTDRSGVSWRYLQAERTNAWVTSYPTGVTGSFVSGVPAGGSWYTSSNGENVESVQTHGLDSKHDLTLDVSTAVKQIYNDTLANRGFILKLSNDLEFNTTSSIKLRYFSVDTNTIYPPCLEFAWDDSSYNPGSLSELSTDIATIGIKNNKGKYIDSGKQRFRLTARPKYPTRTFTTSSAYLTNYALPTASYWGLKDENTEEMVIDYNTFGTKVSCDSSGPYFDIYMGGLQPERYYRILIKSTINGSTVVIDDNNIFKVVRNV